MNPFEKVLSSLSPTSRTIRKRQVFLARNNVRNEARNLLETDYRALRGICTELPQRGKVSRHEIIRAILKKVKQLESEARERGRDRTHCHPQHARPPETVRVVRSSSCTLTGRCKTHPNLRVEQPAQARGGGFAPLEVQVLWDSEQSGTNQRMPGSPFYHIFYGHKWPGLQTTLTTQPSFAYEVCGGRWPGLQPEPGLQPQYGGPFKMSLPNQYNPCLDMESQRGEGWPKDELKVCHSPAQAEQNRPERVQQQQLSQWPQKLCH